MQEPIVPQQPAPVYTRPTVGQRIKKFFAPLLAGLAAVAKPLLVALKFGWPLIKVGGTMFISLWFYAQAFGWPFAAGFIVLLFIHESGHLIAARLMGLKVGLPVFIPFMGAMIALKEAPRNAWIESVVGVGGPLVGSMGAIAMAGLYFVTGNRLFLALGYFGCFLNLFNLIPIVPLDGGRIVSAISPWLWVLGLVIIVPYLLLHAGGFGIFILVIVALSLPRVFALFRRRSPEQMRYFECTPAQRISMALLYFGLLGGLFLAMAILKNLMGLRQIS
ncbi:MAG: site-2 protease family protein [Chthoniobacteraceae bacterium]|jgi:Zn-dependent protease